ERAPTTDPISMLPDLARAIDDALPVTLASLTWSITPTYRLELRMADQTATPTATNPTALMRQRFDFAAAHRLHVPSLSDEENQAAFGKCNNPSGHGHNYGIEPCVAINLSAQSNATPFTLADLERLVDEHLIDPFDHTHLNADTKEFATDTGVNPSVENIARVFFDRLKPAIAEASPAAELRTIRVWETERTSCTYPST
ncbi:MAG: 6-carboxytetrahydropterin synthase, partial [Planctomycetota bacterium]